MKLSRTLLALLVVVAFTVIAVQVSLDAYWKMSLSPRLEKLSAIDSAVAETELKRIQYVEQTSAQFLNVGSSRPLLKINSVPDIFLTSTQKEIINQARRIPVWFKRAELIRKAGIDSTWMSELNQVDAWRTPYPVRGSKDESARTANARGKSPFLGATWAIVRLSSVSKMNMSEAESTGALSDVRNLERLLLTSENHILNLQALQVMSIERDFVQRHRRLFSYLNRWNTFPEGFAIQYRATSAWLPNIWRWGITPELMQSVQASTKSSSIFCSSMEKGMSDALNFRPLLSSKNPEFFQKQMRWGVEWAAICHRPEFAAAWKNQNYVPGAVKEWYAVWNGHSSRWLKMKNILWWKNARVLLGGQVWLSTFLDLNSVNGDDGSEGQ